MLNEDEQNEYTFVKDKDYKNSIKVLKNGQEEMSINFYSNGRINIIKTYEEDNEQTQQQKVVTRSYDVHRLLNKDSPLNGEEYPEEYGLLKKIQKENTILMIF